MKLLKIINHMNQQEISKFYNVLTSIINCLSEKGDETLDKKTDAEGFVKTFNREDIYMKYEEIIGLAVKKNLLLDVITDIIIRDGNCIMSKRWLEDLFKAELKKIKEHAKKQKDIIEGIVTDIDNSRKRDYRIYANCVCTALNNDLENGLEAKVTNDELSILLTLKEELELSNDEARSIYYYIVQPHELMDVSVDKLIATIKDSGVGFYKKNSETIYIPDEIVTLLREIKAVMLPNKHVRRILKSLDDKMINKIKRLHTIDNKIVDRHEKITKLIEQGIDIRSILSSGIFEDDTSENDKKKILNDIIENKLEIHLPSSGRTVQDKISNLINYFLESDRDEKGGVSRDGYERLLQDLHEKVPSFESALRDEFEIQDNVKIHAEVLLDYNIKPRDVLFLLPAEQLKAFCKELDISYRGKNIVTCILSGYKDTENEFIENYSLIAKNDINGLKNNGVRLKSDMIGSTFEAVTKKILAQLGFNVNEELRQSINSKTHKADIVLDLGNDDVIIVECKSSKKNYNKFSNVTRQIGAYNNHFEKAGKNIKGSVLISGEFSDDFVQEADFFTDYNITLIEADTLINIFDEFKSLKKDSIPVPLFTRAGLMKEDVVITALQRGK